ncbi:MAG: T9SS type A sorting domain-containing protein [Flavobacteriales bacterium]|nr:T9SS type A sorting domain-containing protein [Flavobacteriales bacterium]
MAHLKLFVICILLPSLMMAQTVPNSGFEEWEATPQSTLEPVGWDSDNTQLTTSTSQDTEAYSGNYAMRVQAVDMGLGSYGEAQTLIEMGGLPDGLLFMAKWWRTYSAAVGVQAEFYNENEMVHTDYWLPEDTASTWTQISIAFPPIDIATTHCILRVYAAVGDLVPGDGWLSVDDMDFGVVTSLEELSIDGIKLFPNPATDHLRVEINSPHRYEIFDDLGRRVLDGRTSSTIEVSELREGRYSLLLLTDEGIRSTQSFLIQR